MNVAVKDAVRLFYQYSLSLDPNSLDERITALRFDITAAANALIKDETFGQYEMLMLFLFARRFSITDIAAILHCSRVKVYGELDIIFEAIAEKLGEDYLDGYLR